MSLWTVIKSMMAYSALFRGFIFLTYRVDLIKLILVLGTWTFVVDSIMFPWVIRHPFTTCVPKKQTRASRTNHRVTSLSALIDGEKVFILTQDQRPECEAGLTNEGYTT